MANLPIQLPQSLILNVEQCLGFYSKVTTLPPFAPTMFSSAHPYIYHPVKGLVTRKIWTHDGYLQYATLESGSITIWQVGFASEHPATEVKSLPTPDNFNPSERFLFLPTLCRLAFILQETVLVWDAQHSKLLLNSVDVKKPFIMTFSPDGCFFACGTHGTEIYLWKESPTGYILHQKLISNQTSYRLLFSPDGQPIILSSGSALQLWCTMDSTTPPPTRSTTSPSTHSTHTLQYQGNFILGFSPDESLVAVARLGDKTAVILDLTSGSPHLIIDTGMRIRSLGVTGSTVVVTDGWTVVTWNLPAGGGVFDARARIDDSVQTTVLDHSVSSGPQWIQSALISPDLNYLAIVGYPAQRDLHLWIYDLSTGKHLAKTSQIGHHKPLFSPDGHEIWQKYLGKWKRWANIKNCKSDLSNLEYLGSTEYQPEGCPWVSSHGYKVTDDGWVLSSDGKRLLWLPLHWRVGKEVMVWSGQFLVFLHNQLPEAVVLKLLEE
jgi:hypothetical protein